MGFQSLQLDRLSQNNPHFTPLLLKAHRYFQLQALSVLPCVTPSLPVCCLPILACRCLFFWNVSVVSLFLLAVGDPSECRGPCPLVHLLLALTWLLLHLCVLPELPGPVQVPCAWGFPKFPSAWIFSPVPAPMMCLLSTPGKRQEISSSRPRSVTSHSYAFSPAV